MAFRNLPHAFRVFTLRNVNHPLGLLGMLVMYLSGLLIVVLLLLEILGFHVSPYIGILLFLALPMLFLFGVGLVFLGRMRARKRGFERDKPLYPFPNWDLNDPNQRSRFVLMVVMVSLGLTVFATVSYKGVEFMESDTFCGKVCHTVMQPEHTAYLNSPHARVRCVDCHIGPGANWFVKSKISGLRQVLAVTFNTYQKPVPTPIHNLRPARETCEQCHWPEKFYGDKVLMKKHYQEDEENSQLYNIVLLKVGGGSDQSGFAEGIHWHMNLTNKIEYISDEKREEIYWVRSVKPDGTTHEYVKDGFEMPEGFLNTQTIRRMDCMDCHNRPTHTFHMPAPALDVAIASGRISREIPFIKRETLQAIQEKYPSQDDAETGIAAQITSFYEEEYPDWVGREELVQAVREAVAIYKNNVFPKMEVAWGTYPNHIGHEEFPGCFRCHDEEHSTADGLTISQDCDNCHSLLAWDEEEPEILESLFP